MRLSKGGAPRLAGYPGSVHLPYIGPVVTFSRILVPTLHNRYFLLGTQHSVFIVQLNSPTAHVSPQPITQFHPTSNIFVLPSTGKKKKNRHPREKLHVSPSSDTRRNPPKKGRLKVHKSRTKAAQNGLNALRLVNPQIHGGLRVLFDSRRLHARDARPAGPRQEPVQQGRDERERLRLRRGRARRGARREEEAARRKEVRAA